VERLVALGPRHDRIIALNAGPWTAPERRLCLDAETIWVLCGGQLADNLTPAQLFDRTRRLVLVAWGNESAVLEQLSQGGVEVLSDLGAHPAPLTLTPDSEGADEPALPRLAHRWVVQLPEGASTRAVLRAVAEANATLIELRPLAVGALQGSP
jgi:hypothetical protein